ncbi:MAG: signal peptidase II [Proteobacteria bacterium]|nr:signal peptidase II [Pseudomonadota bacterium]
MKSIIKKHLFIQAILIAIFATILDLYSKNLVFFYLFNHQDYQYLQYPRVKITSFFNLVYVTNNGISFGMFDKTSNAREIFALLQGGIAFGLIFWLWNSQKKHISYALALIIGGAFGNVIDRILNGGVTDFLDFYIGIYHWPAFNLADSLIFIGVLILIYDEFLIKKK